MPKSARSYLLAVILALPCAAVAQSNYYWTGAAPTNTHNVKEWFNPNNWALDSAGSGIIPATGPSRAIDSAPYDNVFLSSSGTTYFVGLNDPNNGASGNAGSYHRINDLTILGGYNNFGGRYSTQNPTLRVDGAFLIQAGQLFAGPYSPNHLQFHGSFTAQSGTSLGNQGSTSDGSYWNLTNATSINLNGVELRHMTNNWQWSPQRWNFGNAPITLSNQNTFNTNQDVVNAPRAGIGSRGALQTIVANNISGTGGITKTGAASLHLSGTNTYSGATTINGGILSASGGNAIGNSSAVSLANTISSANEGAVRPTLWLNASETIGSLAGGGTTGGNVILNGHTLTMGGNNATTTFSGVIAGAATGPIQAALTGQGGTWAYAPYVPTGYFYSPEPALGAGNIVKTGSGTMTLTNTNLYTGTTTISRGFLIIGDSVLSGVAGPLGQSASAIILGDAATPSGSVNAGTVGLRLSTPAANQNLVIDRPLDLSGTTADGRTRIVLEGGAPTDASTLTLSGPITLPASAGRRFEFAAQRQGQLLDIAGHISGTSSITYWNGSNLGLGTIRLSNTANSYTGGNTLSNGTLIIAGDVNASGPSPIGTGSMGLGDGAPPSINQDAGGPVNSSGQNGPINTIPTFFMETPGTTFARTLTLNNTASYAINSITGNGVANGYRIGGLNTSGTTTFSGNINSPTNTNGDTNLTLSAEAGGTTIFSGIINNNPAAGSDTLVNINQFVNHPDLNHASAGQPNGAASTGIVILSAANTYAGPTNVHAGTLLANNSTGSATGQGTVTVLSGATLGGNGSLLGNTTIASGAFLSPGGDAALPLFGTATLSFGGDLTLAAASTTLLDFAAPTGNATPFSTVPGDLPTAGQHDAIDVLGTLLAQGNVAITLDPAYNPLAGDYFVIANYGALGGTPTASFSLPTLSGGLGWTGGFTDTYAFLQITPEPSRALLLGLAAIFPILARRRPTRCPLSR